ncbi:MAG TPA: serine protease [Thermoleophilaceae bacterium]|nr:serine protease [Thermoleophilaceae bacterium]
MRRLALLSLVPLALLVVVPAAGASTREPRVVGGTQAPAGAYPFMAALLDHGVASTYLAQFCGGSLIAPRTVLTAEHCVEGQSAASIDVLVGTGHLAAPGEAASGERIPVSAIAVAPGNDFSTLNNDVAILLLAHAPSAGALTGTIAPVDPTADAGSLQPGDPATVIGWGDTTNGLGQFPQDLRQTDVLFASDQECASAYGARFTPSSMLCADWPPVNAHDSCSGDSGGPLFITVSGARRQAGVVSFGHGCAEPGFPGVYARLAAPQLHSFVTGFIAVGSPPANVSPPAIAGSRLVGHPLTCLPGGWTGLGLSFSYQWLRAVGFSATPVGSGQVYTPTASDAGSFLECRVTARNAVGSSAATSAPVLVANPPSQPVRDTRPPRARLLSRRCARHRCRVRVLVVDPPPSLGIASVRGILASRNRVRCRRAADRLRHRRCYSRLRRRALRASSRDRRIWTFRTPKLRRGRHVLTVALRDKAGNRRPRALRVRLNQ